MKITDIKPQAKNKNRVSIFVDGSFAFGMEEKDCSFMGLKVGMELSEEKYNYIMDNTIYTKAVQKADHYIGFKMRTEKEVRDKLKEDFSEDIIERVIASFIKYKYIDDEAYARMYASDCRRLKKWGNNRIKIELLKRGVDSDLTDSVLAENDEDNSEIIEALLDKRIKSTPIDVKEKQRHINFLLRRGFNYDEIKSAIKKYE